MTERETDQEEMDRKESEREEARQERRERMAGNTEKVEEETSESA